MLLNNKQIQRLHPIKSALLHLVKSSRLHGIHSPFIYHFLEDVVFSDTVSLHFQTIEELRYSLNRNNSELDFNDLGTGNPRKIKIYKIAESGISPSFGRLLYRISGWLTPKSILELGTSLGLSAAYLASGSPESNVISIEGCPQVSKIAGDNLRSLYIKNVSLRVGDITD
jgi:tRNA G46 methylase TrmB